jgi:hypothetical protein
MHSLHRRLGRTWASSLLISCYGLKSFLTMAAPANRRARIVTLAVHANARQQIERLGAWLGPGETGRMRVDAMRLLRPSALAHLALIPWGGGLRGLRLIHAVNRRHDFLVSCRAASGLACYVRARSMLDRLSPRAVAVSSDTNPEEIGFTAAARALGIPTVFISHAYPSPFSPPLDFDLSILEGEGAVDARRRLGPIRGDVLLAGIEGESAPLDARRLEKKRPVIGILAPKLVVWPKLAEIVADCRRCFDARQVLIRWHPSMLERPRLDRALAEASNVVETARTDRLGDVVDRCDWAIADANSNVHLPVLKRGVPTVAIQGLDAHLESLADLYGFQANAIIFPPLTSIADLPIPSLVQFFSGSWVERFARCDASYLRPQDVIAREAREAIQRLVDRDPCASSGCD